MLASFVLPSQVSAQTADEAKETALSFMTQKKGGAVKLSTVNIGKSIAKVKGKGATAADNGGVYAFNAEEGGYCVVCVGNGNTQVAGYSDKGSIDPTNMPDAMKVWLAQYSYGRHFRTALGGQDGGAGGANAQDTMESRRAIQLQVSVRRHEDGSGWLCASGIGSGAQLLSSGP